MKKFISLVAMATILFSAVSCRESEEISGSLVERKLSARVYSDSTKVITSDYNPTVENEPKDPPVKDGQGW